MNISDDLADRLLKRVLPPVYYSVPALDVDLTDFEEVRVKIEAHKLPDKLSLTHYAILSWLRWKKEKQEEITHSDLLVRVQERLSYLKDPYKKLNKKSNELIRLGLIREEPVEWDRRRKRYEITEVGLRVLIRAEEQRKKFLSEIITLLGPERLQAVFPLYEEVVEKLDQKILST